MSICIIQIIKIAKFLKLGNFLFGFRPKTKLKELKLIYNGYRDK